MVQVDAVMPEFWSIGRASSDASPAWLHVDHPCSERLVRNRLAELPATAPLAPGAFVQVHLPPGAATPFDLQKRVEDWVSLAGDDASPYLEVVNRSTRVLWHGARCVVIAAPDAALEGLAAAAAFSVVYDALSSLEKRLENCWPTLEADVPLTHNVGRRELRRQTHVDTMTRQFQEARIFVARMDIALQRPAPQLGPGGRRLYQELVLQADLATRLRLIDDAVEVGEDLYERANDRLIDHRHFTIEFYVEIAILLAILAELAVLIVDFLKH